MKPVLTILCLAGLLFAFTGCATAGSTVVNVVGTNSAPCIIYESTNRFELTNDPPPVADTVASNAPTGVNVTLSGLNPGTNYICATLITPTGQSTPGAAVAAVIPNAPTSVTVTP